MYSRVLMIVLLGFVLLIPSLTFGQHYVSDKCQPHKHNSWELTITSSHSYFDNDIQGKYTRPQQVPVFRGCNRYVSYIGMPVLRDGDGEIWVFDSELLIPVNWGVMSHIITGLKYSTMSTDFLYSNHDLYQDGIMVTFGFKFRF